MNHAARAALPLVLLLLWGCPSLEPARGPSQSAAEPAAPPAKAPAEPTTKAAAEPTKDRPAQDGAEVSDRLHEFLDRSILSKREQWQGRLVKLALGCVDKEYPNKPGQVLASAKEVAPPRKLHPAFFGCFDWHSSVHGHWALVRTLRKYPELKSISKIRAVLNRHLTPALLAKELRYFEAPHHKQFERPYGWAWFLRLTAELHALQQASPGPRVQRWRRALSRLEVLLVQRTRDYLQRLSLPVRAGTHHNTAFALVHILDYARATGAKELEQAVTGAARRYYGKDRRCPVHFEPSGEDFISPCLAEADLMRRILPRAELTPWLAGFLPDPGSKDLEPLLYPPPVSDPKDPKIGHLIGLNFQRAWAMEGLRRSLGEGSPWWIPLAKAARRHRVLGMKLMFDSGYGGAHWLASFATYLLTDVGLSE